MSENKATSGKRYLTSIYTLTFAAFKIQISQPGVPTNMRKAAEEKNIPDTITEVVKIKAFAFQRTMLLKGNSCNELLHLKLISTLQIN